MNKVLKSKGTLQNTKDKGQVAIGARSPAFKVSKDAPQRTKDKGQVMIGARSPIF